MLDNVFEKMPVSLMGKVLDVTSYRQRVVAGNIANNMTPGYQRKEVDFATTLNQTVEQDKKIKVLTNNTRHIELNGAKKEADSTAIVKQSGQVNVEEEMALSAENQLIYSTAAKILGGNFRSLKLAIKGRS